MDPEPLWFGPEDRPLQGWIHRPESGQARGAVVLCPPLGVELNFSQYAYRVLARDLQAAGFVVIRFDYDGTGQSAGDTNDPGRVQAWVGSVSHALGLARTEGVPWVAGVGLRLGATLLAKAAAGNCDFDSLLLWDPCVSGKSFLREQVALQLSFKHAPVEGGTEIPGYLLAPQTIAELRNLELPEELAQRAGGTMVLLDPDRPQNSRLRSRLAGADIEWHDYCEPMMVFDIGERLYDLPEPIIAQIVGWIDERCECAPSPLAREAVGSRRTVVAHTEDGRPVVEELLTLGPTGLFGIAAEVGRPDGAQEGDLPVVLFLSMAAEPSIGPGRQWVKLSREWAADGYRCIRFDLSGIGESPVRSGKRERHIYAPWALDDITEAARAISPGDPRGVVLVGVCSGAYSALAIAPHLRPTGVVAINPVLTFAAFEGWAPTTPGQEVDSRRRLDQRARRALRRRAKRLVRAMSAHSRGAAWRKQLANRLPPVVWSVVFKLRLSHSPARLVAPILESEVPTLLLCGEREAKLPRARTPRPFRDLEEACASHFTVVPELDHSLRDETSRIAARNAIKQFIDGVERLEGQTSAAQAQPRLTPSAASALA